MVFRLVSLLVLLGLCSFGCLGGASVSPALMPNDPGERRTGLTELSVALFEALRGGSLDRAIAPRSEVDQLVAPEMRFRIERERAGRFDPGLLETFRRDWAGATFAGFCAQGARDEAAERGLGLVRPGWVLDRLLVVANVGGGRSASWLEGRFVYTARGWRTLSLTRIEEPRRHHSDLELAPCDVESGLH